MRKILLCDLYSVHRCQHETYRVSGTMAGDIVPSVNLQPLLVDEAA